MGEGLYDAEAYKHAKEAFVSNLKGSGKYDLLEVFTVAAVCALFHRTVSPLLPNNTIAKFVLEMLYLVTPPLITITFTEYTLPMYAAMITISALAWISTKKEKKQGSKLNDPRLESLNSPRKPFLDEYRAHMMLMTCLAILAVDFTVFPRKFAKTETYGISVMDMGVGCVVLSGALVSRQARSASNLTEKKQPIARKQVRNSGRLYFIWGALKSCLPLLVLGLARIVLTKSANYQEHVSEYGVHWNFFFTLSFVALVTALINIPVQYSAATGLAIVCGYQLVLSNFGLQDYILNHPRDNIISANKEGLCSIFGYLSIYLIGTQLGYLLFKPRRSIGEWQHFTLNMFLWTLGTFACAYAAETYVDPISRRMANLAYVLYTVAFTLYIVTSCLVVSLFCTSSPSVILSAINRNQLFFFLLGNIATGAVNVSMYTLYTPPLIAMGVLFVYVAALCAVVVILDKLNITLRI